MSRAQSRHRAQAGTTMVELLVSLVIASLALALIVGTLSTGLLDATLAKRNAAAQAVLEYERESVSSSTFDPGALPYSDCFATENTSVPAPASGYQGACTGPYTLRADVSWSWLPSSPGTVQVWTISISTWPDNSPIGSTLSTYKIYG